MYGTRAIAIGWASHLATPHAATGAAAVTAADTAKIGTLQEHYAQLWGGPSTVNPAMRYSIHIIWQPCQAALLATRAESLPDSAPKEPSKHSKPSMPGGCLHQHQFHRLCTMVHYRPTSGPRQYQTAKHDTARHVHDCLAFKSPSRKL